MGKRFISVLLTLAMLVTCAPVIAFADSDPKYDVVLPGGVSPDNGYVIVSEMSDDFSELTDNNILTTASNLEFASGTNLKLTAVSKYGYKLKNISVTYGGVHVDTSTGCCIKMPASTVEVYAEFVENDTPAELSEHTKMWLSRLAEEFNDTTSAAIESVAYYFSDPANNAGLVINSDLLNDTYSIVDNKNADPHRYIKTIAYVETLSLASALNRAFLDDVIGNPLIDEIKCIVNNAGPFAYKVADLLDAVIEQDWDNVGPLASAVDEDRANLCALCFKEGDSLPCYDLMREYFTNDDINGDPIQNPEDAYSKFAEVICSVCGIEEADTISKFRSYALKWLNDESNHFIFNNYVNMLPVDKVKKYNDAEMASYINEALVRSVLSLFDSITQNYFGLERYTEGKVTDNLRCTLDHIMQLKEVIMNILDAVYEHYPNISVASSPNFTTENAIAFYESLLNLNLECSNHCNDYLASAWGKLRTAIAVATNISTGAFEVTDADGVRTIKLLRDIERVSWYQDPEERLIYYDEGELSVASGTDIILDLNGHSLNAKGTFDEPKRVFNVEGKLTIMDSTDKKKNGTGKGKICGGFVTDDGGAIVVENGGELIINSGAICDNKAVNISEQGQGGGAIDCFGKLTINGGAIFHNSARWGGAIGLNKGAEFLMTGGRIYENESLTMDGSAINMWNDWNKGDITSTIIGGEIYGNISNYTTGDVDGDSTEGGVESAGNAIWVEGTLYLGGTAKIYGNRQGKYTTGTGWTDLTENANLGIVNNNEDGNARGTIKISSEHPLKKGANIWLSSTSEHVKVVPFEVGDELTDYDITSANGFTAENIQYFRIDTKDGSKGYAISAEDSKFYVAKAKETPQYIFIPDRVAPIVETPAAITPAAITPAAIDDEILTKYSDLDVNGWYHDGILFCLNEGYMDGVGNDLFNPSGKTTRGMMMTILARVAGQTVNATGAEWYKDGLSWAVAEGLTDGTLPAGEITREQFATMLYRYAQKQGQGFVGSWMFLLKYPDASNVSSWANEAIHWCTMKGILDGYEDGTLAPQGLLTRAEAAAMIQRYCTLQ